MVKTKRAGTIARRPGNARTAKTDSTKVRPAAVSVETLREQADRLGLLDPLEEEPGNVFSGAWPESEP